MTDRPVELKTMRQLAMPANTAHVWRGWVRGLAVVCLAGTLAQPLWAGTDGNGVLTGTVTDFAGTPVPFAMVTATSADTGQVRPAATWTDGTYAFSLPPGKYRVRFESTGYQALEIPSAMVSMSWRAVLDEKLMPDEQTNSQAAPAQNPTPSNNPTAPTLEDLGISPAQAKGNAKDQALLDKRSHMLQIHQRLGLIAAAPMIASLFTSTGAKGHHGMPGSASARELHGVLGAATTDLYFTSAYFAIRAPKIPGTETRGPIRVHKALAWIHGPGMILTPILGAIAYSQESNGQKVHGIAKYHSDVAYVTAAAYGAAIISVSVKF